jgi:uncharacterized membrane protein YozB (DUF420 family)
VIISESKNSRWTRENVFFTAMAVGMTIVVFVGFSQSFFLRPMLPEAPEWAAPETVFYIHGLIFSAWMVLLLIQTSLVGSHQIQTHRRLGISGAFLAALMVIVGVLISIVAARRPGGFIGATVPPLQELVIPIFDMVLFGLFAGLAIACRRNSQSHKRLILLATINLLHTAIARIPMPNIGISSYIINHSLADVFIIFLVTWDLITIRRLHPVTLWAGLLTIVSQPLRLWVADTQPWLSMAGWVVGAFD